MRQRRAMETFWKWKREGKKTMRQGQTSRRREKKKRRKKEQKRRAQKTRRQKKEKQTEQKRERGKTKRLGTIEEAVWCALCPLRHSPASRAEPRWVGLESRR